jgi:hypothetical protein
MTSNYGTLLAAVLWISFFVLALWANSKVEDNEL